MGYIPQGRKESDTTKQHFPFFHIHPYSTFYTKGFPGGSVVKNPPASARRPEFDPWVGKIPWKRERLPTPAFWPGEIHGVAQSWTRLSDFHFVIFEK